MGRSINPRRVPRTQADVEAAYTKGVTEGLNRGIELMLYVLIDKHAAPMEDVQQLAAELNHAAGCVAEGYVTWAGVRRMLKEYDVEVELTWANGGSLAACSLWAASAAARRRRRCGAWTVRCSAPGARAHRCPDRTRRQRQGRRECSAGRWCCGR